MKKIILFITILFILLNLVSATLTTEIDIKKSFGLGDTISFTYTISSEIPIQIIYRDYIDCPNVPVPFLEQKQIDLKSGEPYTDTYFGIIIDKSIEPQNCTAYISIIDFYKQTISKNFSIITNPSFSFELKICKDQACIEKTKVFIKNEEIYLDYDSEVPEPIVIATLTLPDQSTEQITLPTSINAKQIGTYNLEVTASKDGYKSIINEYQFGVITEDAPISEGKLEIEKDNLWWILILISILILMVFFIVFLIYTRRKSNVPDPDAE